MKLITLVAVAILAAVLGACKSETVPAKNDPAVVAPIGAAAKDATAKAAAADEAERKTREMAAANVTNIQKANTQNPEGPVKATIADEANLALNALGAPPDPKELLAGEQRARLRAEGKAEAAEKLSSESAARANAAAAELALARADRDAALAKVDAAIAEAEAKIRTNNAAHDTAMRSLQSQHRTEVAELKRQIEAKEVGFLSYVVGGIGGLCLLAAIGIAVGSFYSPLGFKPKSIGVIGLLVVSAIGCFGLVRFLSHPWIPYAVAGVIIVLVGTAAVLWFVNWRETRQRHEAVQQTVVEKDSKLRVMTETAAHVVDQLEQWAGERPAEAKALFARIGDATDQKHKELIAYLKSVRPSKKPAPVAPP